MLRVPKGQPTEKDTMEFSLALARRETMAAIEEIANRRGLIRDVLTARPAGGDESIGINLCGLVAVEWDVVNRLNQIVKKPMLTGEEIWSPFLEDGTPYDLMPDYEVIRNVMEKARAQLIDTLRSAGGEIMDTVLMPGHNGLEGTVRYWCVFLVQHETARRARIELLDRLMS